MGKKSMPLRGDNVAIKKIKVQGTCAHCKRPLMHKEPVFVREGGKEKIVGDICPDCAMVRMTGGK